MSFFKIDLISPKENTYEIEKFKNRIKIKFEDSEIFVISPEDLIISKLIWSRSSGGLERQIRDCESIYKLNYGKTFFRFLVSHPFQETPAFKFFFQVEPYEIP